MAVRGTVMAWRHAGVNINMDDTGAQDKLQDILALGNQLTEINDVDILLEEILSKARMMLNADAGSIYVREGNELAISFAQNATKEQDLPKGEKLIYKYFKIPITTKTIAGYCAASREWVMVDDVYKIPSNTPYSFNKSFDMQSGYRTQSVVAVPLIASGGEVMGIIQLINKMSGAQQVISFDKNDLALLNHFAVYASAALYRAQITRSLLVRMTKMAELRDPKETHNHVQRVAAYSIELYERWANANGYVEESIRKTKDVLRMAAMLHDVGKVAISDIILKKPGSFTEEERSIMQTHTFMGARLFSDNFSDLDKAARSVSLNHHENWDGTGYPGHINYDSEEAILVAANGDILGKREYEIPLFGRIVSICDVYDALRSSRVYKKNWTLEKTLEEMDKLSGTKFDPDLIDVFLKIIPNIRELEERYSDNAESA